MDTLPAQRPPDLDLTQVEVDHLAGRVAFELCRCREHALVVLVLEHEPLALVVTLALLEPPPRSSSCSSSCALAAAAAALEHVVLSPQAAAGGERSRRAEPEHQVG